MYKIMQGYFPSKVIRGSENIDKNLHSKNIIGLYETENRRNTDFRSRTKWNDMSGKNNDLVLNSFNFNDNIGWLNNLLSVRNKAFVGKDLTKSNSFTYQLGLIVDTNDSVSISLPGIGSIITDKNKLIIKVTNTDIIEINDCIEYNKFFNLSISYSNNILKIFKDSLIISQTQHTAINTNIKVLIGKDINNIFGNFYITHLIMYNTILTDDIIIKNATYLRKKYITYYVNGLLLDIRGTDPLIYNGLKYIKDNSIYNNHFLTDIFFNSINQNINRNAYKFNGYNQVTCHGRKLINEEFTIEMSVQGIDNMLPTKTFLCGNFSNKHYGFRIGLNTLGFIVEFGHPNGNMLFTYGMEYISRMVHLAITYKDNLLCIYVNGIRVKMENFEFKNIYKDFNLYIAKQDNEWDGYKGLVNSMRIYNKALTQDTIRNNYNLDREFYTVI